jgi:hypothetical protein
VPVAGSDWCEECVRAVLVEQAADDRKVKPQVFSA